MGASGSLDPKGALMSPLTHSGLGQGQGWSTVPPFCLLFMFPFRRNQVLVGLLLCCLLRISRLFSDVKKILLYSQNDKNLDGFKELSRALELLQDRRSGRRRAATSWRLQGNLRRCSPASHHTKNFFLCLMFSVFVSAGAALVPGLLEPASPSHCRSASLRRGKEGVSSGVLTW